MLLERLGEVGVGFGQLARPLLDLVLEVRVRLLERPGRPVELLAERLQLVTGPDLDAVAEIAGADARGAFLERANRRHHSPCEEQARENRQPEAQHEDDGAPDDRIAQGRVGVRGRAFDEDEPAERTDRRVSGQDLGASQAVGDHGDLVGGGFPTRGPRRLHLDEGGEIALRPHDPTVGMGGQMVARIHHVGVAPGTDLDLRDDLQDGAQADLRRRHLDRVLAHRDGQRHVRLGLVSEVDGAPVRLAHPGLDELRRPRQILLAADDVGVQAGDPELFPAGEVEMAELGHGGRVAEDPEEIELALLGQRRAQPLAESQLGLAHLARVGIVGRGPGRVPHLLLDVLQELLDASRRRHRLRALDSDDRALGFPVGEVDLDQAGGHQHAANEDEEDDDVLAIEPAARGRGGHRRKASARNRILRGTASPNSSAVLRFTARSIFSAPSTERSPGRAPRRILATSEAAWTPCA